MESNKAKSCLKTFLEVSQIQLALRDKAIQKKQRIKLFLDTSKKTEVNQEIVELKYGRSQIQGRLDSVRLEMLDMILDEPSLISPRIIAKKGCSSVVEFVKQEKESIELRGLYKEFPCSIAEVLNKGLEAQQTDISFSMFDKPQIEATKQDVKVAVDEKNIKIMTKSM